jgi:hypothetical protein
MSRVLRFVLIDFQAFPRIARNSTRHARDMEPLSGTLNSFRRCSPVVKQTRVTSKAIPHVENVELVKETESQAAVPGFQLHVASLFSVGLLILFLLAYSILF